MTTTGYSTRHSSRGISQVSQFVQRPREKHMRTVEHVLKYLSGTYTDSIYYGKDSHRLNKLWDWVDTDFATDLDTRRSHTGYILMLNTVSWKSTKQKSVSLRTPETVGMLVDKDDLINYQLLIIYQLLIRTFTYQPTVDKIIVAINQLLTLEGLLMIVDKVWKLTNTVRVGLDARSSHAQTQSTFPDTVCSHCPPCHGV
jgi:hypothetical protein